MIEGGRDSGRDLNEERVPLMEDEGGSRSITEEEEEEEDDEGEEADECEYDDGAGARFMMSEALREGTCLVIVLAGPL